MVVKRHNEKVAFAPLIKPCKVGPQQRGLTPDARDNEVVVHDAMEPQALPASCGHLQFNDESF